MKTSIFLLVMAATTTVTAQPARPLPPDIDPQSYSRLPLIPKDTLDAEGQRIFEAINGEEGKLPRLGPPANSMHSLAAAEPYDRLNQVLRKTIVGMQFFEISTLVPARIQPAVRMDGPRDGGTTRGCRSKGHRRHQIQSARERTTGEGSHGHRVRARDATRHPPSPARDVRQDGLAVRPPRHDGYHHDHGRLHDDGHALECGRSAPTPRPGAAAPDALAALPLCIRPVRPVVQQHAGTIRIVLAEQRQLGSCRARHPSPVDRSAKACRP